MAENRDITLQPEKIRFTKKGISIADSRFGRYKIPYRDLVLASIRISDKGAGFYEEPGITDITEEMEGDLFLWDIQKRCFKIRTKKTGRAAGSLLSELGRHAPYILVGKQDWANLEDEVVFSEISGMVRLMRECYGKRSG